MRIGSFQSYISQTSRMADLQSTIDRLQTQIATGKRVLRPSDDPLGANRVVDLQRSITDNQQFIRNMDTITTQISLADSAAESMSNQLVRARELAIIAANGTMTATHRPNISTELSPIIVQLLASATHTRSSSYHLFSAPLI